MKLQRGFADPNVSFSILGACQMCLSVDKCAIMCYWIGLCSAIPGFGELCQQDKAVLMETAYFEIWLVTFMSRSVLTSNSLNFNDLVFVCELFILKLKFECVLDFECRTDNCVSFKIELMMTAVGKTSL